MKNNIIEKRKPLISFLVVINIMFFTTINVLETFLGFLNPAYGTLFVYLRVILVTFLLIFQTKHYGFHMSGRSFVWFVFIYTCFLFYYIFINPQVKSDDLKAAPHLVIVFFMNTYILFVLLFCAETIIKYFKLNLYLFLSFVICTIVSLFYIETIGIDYMLAVADNDDTIISGMGIAYANAPIIALALTNPYSLLNNKIISIVIAIAISSAVGYLLLVIGERGPLLWPLITIAVVYFFKNKISFKYIILLSCIIALVVVNFDSILESIGGISDNTVKRIEEALEGNTNGRTDSDGVFVRGIEEFQKAPLLGHYFRITIHSSFFYGHFPHNMFIEILMTMGIIGFIPYFILLFKTLVNIVSFFRKRTDDNMIVCLVFFSLVFFQLQVSSTIVFNYQFWLFFYILYNIKVFSSKKVCPNIVKRH